MLLNSLEHATSFVLDYALQRPGSGFAPTHLDGLVLWLDASDGDTLVTEAGSPDGVLSQWQDKSGNDLHASADTGAVVINTHSLKGIPVPYFDGASCLSLGTPALLDFNVGTINVDDGDQFTLFVVTGTPGDGEGALISKAHGGAYQYNMYIGGSGDLVWRIGGRSIYGAAGAGRGGWKTFRGDAGPLDMDMYIDGTSAGTTNQHEFHDVDVDVLIGGRRDLSNNTGLAQPLTGTIAEIIVYNRQLSAAEALQVEAYITAKWRARTAEHTLLMLGDSIIDAMATGDQLADII